VAASRRAPLRIGIVDDHPIFRLGLRRALEREPDLEIAWELGSAANLEATMRKTPIDLLLVDVYLGAGKDGLVAARMVAERWPDVKVAAISASLDARVAQESTRAGASLFLRKAMPIPEMLSSIRRLAAPGPALSRRGRAVKASGPVGRLSGLSPRQRQVLEYLRVGRTNKEIAARLGVSVATVNKHVHQVLSALHVSNRTQAAAALNETAES
jgi:DNA-binding NarL/FixJ family response regulator